MTWLKSVILPSSGFAQRQPQQWGLALLLLSLHGVMVWGFDSILTKALLLSHYGLFLLWQPIWRGEQRLSPVATILFIAGGALLVLTINWWVLAFWQAMLFGLLGGRIVSTQAKYLRLGYLLAAGYLLTTLMIWNVPKLLKTPAEVAGINTILVIFLPLLPASLFFLKTESKEDQQPLVFDFFYSLLLLLLAVILVLGSFAIESSSHTEYPDILIRLLFGIAAALLALSWLWNPRVGFMGIGQLLSRYLLSVGMPFEHWLNKIALLEEMESSAAEFATAAVAEVAALPWVSGGNWCIPETGGEFGERTRYHATFDYRDFSLTLYTRWQLTPALLLHIKLLARLLGEFYVAKRREEVLKESTYMQAVHETGSRLTHDIKNLVQSLSTLCAAANQTGQHDGDKLIALFQRQLPQLNRRLELTLDKLREPQLERQHMVKVSTWWQALKRRYAGNGITFSSRGVPPEMDVGRAMFDNIADNLLQNALEKAKAERSLEVRVDLNFKDGLILNISDNGSAIPEHIAVQMFRAHVISENGLGIGLYFAARQARQAGYELKLSENRDGRVCFTLEHGRKPT